MPATVKPRTLEDLIAFNAANEEREMPYFGQETFIASQARGPLTDQAYLDARAKCIELTRTKGIDATMDKYTLDAMLGPSGGIASLVDLAGGGGGGGGPAARSSPQSPDTRTSRYQRVSTSACRSASPSMGGPGASRCCC